MNYKEKHLVTSKIIKFKGCAYIESMIAILLISFLISGCATGEGGRGITGADHEPFDPSYKSQSTGETAPGIQTETLDKQKKDPSPGKSQQSVLNEKHSVNLPAELKPLLAVMPAKTRRPKKEKYPSPSVYVELAFDNADLHEVLDITLYELFKVSYMVDPTIKAKLTFHVSGDFTKQQFINTLNNILQLNNLAIVKGAGDMFKVVRRASSASVGNAPLALEAEPDQAGDLTRMIRLKYIAAATAAKNIKPFVSKNAVVVQDTVTNSLIITDTVDNLDKAASILGMMDVEYFTEISWRVFPVMETDASDVARDLYRILQTGGLYNRPGMDKGSFEIVPIKTMNALLIVTRWPSILELIEDWITAMDHAGDSGTNVFVYFVENGTAVELAEILQQLYGASATGSSKKIAIVKPTAKEAKADLAGELSGVVEIIPDETNNAIVFKASGRDYKIIREVLKKLDIVPRQVLINVVIAEITLSGSLEYGVQWYLKGAMSDYKTRAALDDGTTRTIDTVLGKGTEGLSLAVFDSSDFLRGLVTALETEGEINILSSPNILAVDNKESIIEVGEQIPIPTGETVTDGGTTIKSIQYRDTGVLLTVTPHINSSGLIKMELSQEVSEVGTKDEDLDAFSFLNRKAETSLVVEDGQTIFIGGLMRSKLDTSGSGIPFLRRIPILGYAFGGTSKKISKTELIFVITPRIFKNREEADAITKEFSQRVENIRGLIKKKDY